MRQTYNKCLCRLCDLGIIIISCCGKTKKMSDIVSEKQQKLLEQELVLYQIENGNLSRLCTSQQLHIKNLAAQIKELQQKISELITEQPKKQN